MSEVTFETIVAGGEIVDGSAGALPVRADIGIRDGRIAAIGDLSARGARERIDAIEHPRDAVVDVGRQCPLERLRHLEDVEPESRVAHAGRLSAGP